MLSADPAREGHVLGHNRHASGVNGAQVRVLEQRDQVSLRRLLEREDGRRLEAEVRLELLRNLANQTLERELPDEQLGVLLVAPDLAEGDGSGAVAVRLLRLDTLGRVRSQLLASPGGGLLGARHFLVPKRICFWFDQTRWLRYPNPSTSSSPARLVLTPSPRATLQSPPLRTTASRGSAGRCALVMPKWRAT